MISIVKKKNKISRDLLSKIEWACRLNSIKFEQQKILEGCLRVIEHTNLAKALILEFLELLLIKNIRL